MLTEYEQEFLKNGYYKWNLLVNGNNNFSRDLYASWAILLFVYDENANMAKPDKILQKYLRRFFKKWEEGDHPNVKRKLLYRAHLICNDMFLKRFVALAIILSYNPRHDYIHDERLQLITNQHNISRKEIYEYFLS